MVTVTKFNKKKSALIGGVVMTAALLATVILLPQANADLVLEEEAVSEPNVVGPQAPQSKLEDRANLRSAISTSERLRPSKNIKLPTQIMENEVYSAQPAEPVEMASKSDLLRRERVRQELQNEDMLQQRLEELRLKDEKKRSDDLAQALNGKKEQKAEVIQPLPLQQEAVGVSAITPTQDNLVLTKAAPVSVSDDAAKSDEDLDKIRIMVTPRIGVAGMSEDAYGGLYQVSGRFAVGGAVGIMASHHLALEVGYTYGEYGITPANYAVYQPVPFEPLTLSQHVFDAGARLFVLGSDSKVKPYIGASAGYGKARFGVSQSQLNYYGNVYSGPRQDYELNQFLGSITAGLDVAVTKSILVGAGFKYTTVLSAEENNPVYSYIYNPYYPQQNSAAIGAGQSFAKSGFYSIFGSVSFTF